MFRAQTLGEMKTSAPGRLTSKKCVEPDAAFTRARQLRALQLHSEIISEAFTASIAPTVPSRFPMSAKQMLLRQCIHRFGRS